MESLAAKFIIRPVLLVVICCVVLLPAGPATAFFPGYLKSPWDTEVARIMKSYPKGALGRLHNQVIYKQTQPSKDLRQRSFAFRDNKLYAVTVSYTPAYVQKIGIENLLATHQKNFGQGQMDRSNAPHLISYSWEDEKTKIIFAYAPRKPEYTVLMFQKK